MKVTLILCLIVLFAGLGYWNWQKSQQQLKELKASGFVVSEDLRGNPRLVIDNTKKQFAVVGPNDYIVFPLTTIKSAEVKYDLGTQVESNFRVEINLPPSMGKIQPVGFENEALARDAHERLTNAMAR